jgi:hypothetical protein
MSRPLTYLASLARIEDLHRQAAAVRRGTEGEVPPAAAEVKQATGERARRTPLAGTAGHRDGCSAVGDAS